MAKKSTKSKKNKNSKNLKGSKNFKNSEKSNQQTAPTWQEIAQAQKPLPQKAIELLNDPTKHLITPKEEVLIEKQIKIKTQPDPTHTIVTELSAPRVITRAQNTPPKKVLKAHIVPAESQKLTPEAVEKLKLSLQASELSQEEDDPIKAMKEAAKNLMSAIKKKIKK